MQIKIEYLLTEISLVLKGAGHFLYLRGSDRVVQALWGFSMRGRNKRRQRVIAKRDAVLSKTRQQKRNYFKLTEKGNAVYKIHNRLHQEFLMRDKPVFEQITDKELESMLELQQRYNEHLDGLIANQKS